MAKLKHCLALKKVHEMAEAEATADLPSLNHLKHLGIRCPCRRRFDSCAVDLISTAFFGAIGQLQQLRAMGRS